MSVCVSEKERERESERVIVSAREGGRIRNNRFEREGEGKECAWYTGAAETKYCDGVVTDSKKR